MSPPQSDLLSLGGFEEKPVGRHRLRASFALAAAVVAALGLAACGRKGELELPPGPATQPPLGAAPMAPSFLPPSASTRQQQDDATAAKNGFDSRGNPVAGPGQKRTFFLDPILQ
jgi:predicted small lipoprotein YifL